jgi:PRTRC genetic system protein E
MFTELYAVARHTPLQISVTPEGARLNVLIIPKPGDDADEASALAKPIQAIGTPEELDRELPAKLKQYCTAINDLRLKIDMPIEAIAADAVKGSGKKKANIPARTPARASAPTPKKKAAPTPVKPARTGKLVKATRTAAAPKTTGDTIGKAIAGLQQVSNGRTLAEVHPEKYDNPLTDYVNLVIAETKADLAYASTEPATAPKKSKRATRDECLADLRTYLAECENTNVTITRALFIEHNTTGRSYERKFKNWDEFLAEARKAPGDASVPAAVASNPVADAPNAGNDSPPAQETLSHTTINPAGPWPFPQTQPATPPAKTFVSRVVYDEEGKLLGTIADAIHIHDVYTHPQLGTFRVIETEYMDDGSQRITVAPWSDAAAVEAPADNPTTAPLFPE